MLHFSFSPVARLVLESDNFGRLKIQSENTNRYLCMNKKGKLVTRVRNTPFFFFKDHFHDYNIGIDKLIPIPYDSRKVDALWTRDRRVFRQ